MSFHIKCLFGKHDWETVNSIRERKILESLSGEMVKTKIDTIDFKHGHPRGTHPYFSDHKDGRLYKQKICLRCCITEDGVAEYIEKFNDENRELQFKKSNSNHRQEQAKSMVEVCAVNKFVEI